MVKIFWRTETMFFLSAWLLLMIAGRSRFFGDPGSLWHIVGGEHILSSGELMHTDSFSFTFAGKPWIDQWWLAEVLVALFHRMGGLDMVLLATAVLLAAFYTWVLGRFLRVGVHPLLAALVTVLAIFASAYHFHPRPHLFTIVLLGWTFAQLCDFEAGRVQLSSLFWLIPVFVVWTNLHGGMVGGVVTMGLTLAGWGVAKVLGQETPVVRYVQLISISVLVAGCALAALVNPYGAELPRVWFVLIESPVLPQLMEEHAPLLRSGSSAWPVLLFGLVYVAALAGVWPKRPRVTWLIPLVWFALAWTRIRHGPLFAVTAVLALAEMFPHIRWVASLAKKGSVTCRIRVPEPGNEIGWPGVAVPVLVILVTATLQVSAVQIPVVGRGWASPDPRSSPTELLPELRTYAAAHPEGTPIFNDMLYGGFLIYHTPSLRVFIDDRCELYGNQWLEEFADAECHHPERIETWAQEYGFEYALVKSDTGFGRYLDCASRWSVVKRIDTAVLFRREAAVPCDTELR